MEGFDRLLPEGERVLWSGSPDTRAWLRRSWSLRAVWLWAVAAAALLAMGQSGISIAELAWVAGVGVIGTLFVAGTVAWTCRATRYVITDRRVVMAIGLALQGEANIPFASLRNAAVRRYGDGTGDIALRTDGSLGVGYLILWPHARPWRLARPEPTLRAVPDVDHVAATLTEAMKAAGVGAMGRQEAAPGKTETAPGARGDETIDSAAPATLEGAA